MEFRQATDRISKAGVTLAQVADAFGVTRNTVSRWRRPHASTNRNAFNPPADWPATLKQLAKREARASATNIERLNALIAALDP